MKYFLLMITSLIFVSCNSKKKEPYLESATNTDYSGSLRQVAEGRTLSAYHACVFDEGKALELSVNNKNKPSKFDSQVIAEKVIKTNIPLYSVGSTIQVERLKVKEGFIDLVYFTKRVPSYKKQPKKNQSSISTVIPVYADGTYELPKGL